MRLFLLRHAEAEPPVHSDEARMLTPKGIEQATRAGDYCRRVGLQPDLVLCSPYRRTVQTAEIVAAAWQPKLPTQAEPFLGSGMLPGTAFEALRAYRQFENVLLVGHQPDLGLLGAALLGIGEGDGLPFRLCTLASLRLDRCAPGGGSLELFVPLSLMR